MFDVRKDEPYYAFLHDPETEDENRYGNPIGLLEKNGQPESDSMRINGDDAVGTNPNRNKQHGFHFTADNCIGCHACEAACSEKNNLPPHLAFRSVGYVEGGSYPDYSRINISMACNHCDDPVCLKGCPTRAYTKFAEYGAVLQDPDICFGCGYCTWVCPYNAPQLDPVEGHVQKCNMCVDRLEVGLKPACVSACLGNALEFGVIENVPENREQIKTTIPGFPTPDITQPNIRFQQTKSVPRTFTRPDSEAVKYHLDEESGRYIPELDLSKAGQKREWNLSKLSSRENPLVIFTLVTQAVIGAFIMLFVGAQLGIESFAALSATIIYPAFLFCLLGLQAAVLYLSTQHLGKPMRFYRGFNNLRHSPLSREALGVALFFGMTGAHWLTGIIVSQDLLPLLTPLLPPVLAQLASEWAAVAVKAFGWLAAVSGLAGVYFMTRIYRIKARPFWDHWQVSSSFYGTMLSLGGILLAAAFIAYFAAFGGDYTPATLLVSTLITLGLALEGFGLISHASDMKRRGSEGAVSFHEQITKFGNTYLMRNALIGLNMLMVSALAVVMPQGIILGLIALLAAISISASALAGRALFYVLVIPTTMPGAFFWKNKGFQEHARQTGLANMPQVGVVPDAH